MCHDRLKFCDFDRLFQRDNHFKQGSVRAQTKGQFHLIYGAEGTQALFTGLATQVVYGGCDHDTASFYSDASGTAMTDVNPDPNKAHMRQRPLLTVDEVVTPQMGNCTIFARYVEPAFATQVILTARLTRLYEREDWKSRLVAANQAEPLLLERGVSVHVQPLVTPPQAETVKLKAPQKRQDALAQAAVQAMARATEKARISGTSADKSRVKMTDVSEMKRRRDGQRHVVSTVHATNQKQNDDSGQEQDRR